jgi:hypothetical protein
MKSLSLRTHFIIKNEYKNAAQSAEMKEEASPIKLLLGKENLNSRPVMGLWHRGLFLAPFSVLRSPCFRLHARAGGARAL